MASICRKMSSPVMRAAENVPQSPPGEHEEVLHRENRLFQQIEQIRSVPEFRCYHETTTMKGLTDIRGIRVGHVSDFDAITGCTAILCEQGAVAGVDIRGSASGTEETPTLDPGHVTQPDSRHSAGRRQRLRPGSRLRRAALPGTSRGGLRHGRGQSAHRSRGHPVRSGDRQSRRASQPGDGRSGGRRQPLPMP